MESYNLKKKVNTTNNVKSLLSKGLGLNLESGLGDDSDLSNPSYEKELYKKSPNSILKNNTNNSSYSNLHMKKSQNDSYKMLTPTQHPKILESSIQNSKKSRKDSLSSKNISPINLIQKQENNPRSVSESPTFWFNKNKLTDKSPYKRDETYEMANHDNSRIKLYKNHRDDDDAENQLYKHNSQKMYEEKNDPINERFDMGKYNKDGSEGKYIEKKIGFEDKDDERFDGKYFMKNKEEKRTVLKIQEYEKLIEKQNSEITALKSKLGTKYFTPKYPKSVSPYGEKQKNIEVKQKNRIHVKNKDFWRLDDKYDNMEPTKLDEVPGYKDLWIFNIESKMDAEKGMKSLKKSSNNQVLYKNYPRWSRKKLLPKIV